MPEVSELFEEPLSTHRKFFPMTFRPVDSKSHHFVYPSKTLQDLFLFSLPLAVFLIALQWHLIDRWKAADTTPVSLK